MEGWWEGGCEVVTVTEGSRTDFNSLLIHSLVKAASLSSTGSSRT